MNYELNKIVRVLRTSLLPHNVMRQKDPEKYFSAYTTRILDCLSRQEQDLKDSSLFLPANADFTNIRNHPQLKNSLTWIPLIDRDATRALNILYAVFYTKYADEFRMLNDELTSSYYRIFEKLRALLIYVRTTYCEFCDRKSLVPHFYRMHRMKEAALRIRQIEKIFGKTDAPHALIRELEWKLQLMPSPNWPVTYEYIRTCKGSLLCMAYANTLLRENHGSVMSVFFYFHIDNTRLRNAYIDTVSALANEYESTDARMFFYYYQAKIVNQAIMDQDRSYDEQRVGILENLRQWLDAEITYLEKVRPLNPAPIAPAPQPDGSISAAGKLKVNLSVHELGLLFKLMAESELIEHTDFTDITKRIIPYLKTGRVEEVLFNSVRSKVHEYDKKLYEKLYEKVAKLLRVIGKGKAGEKERNN